MIPNRWARVSHHLLIGAVAAFAAGCGGGSGSSNGSGGPVSGGGATGSNVAPITVDAGPTGISMPQANLLYVTVTICAPNTSTCDTVDHVQVDTGSEGLRILAGSLPTTLPQLPQQKDSAGNPISECAQFADLSYIFGTVHSADVQVAGETAKGIPFQLIENTTAPTSCSQGQTGGDEDTPDLLGANGLLGIGPFRQDCGGGCAQSAIPGTYYSCTASGCTSIAESLTAQLQNPVWMFPADNNGVLIQLPQIPSSGQGFTQGSLIFGIGTQSNNGLSTAKMISLHNDGNFDVQFNGQSFTDAGVIDSGSNGFFFLDSTTTGLPGCGSNPSGFYCPGGSPQTFSTTIIGTNAASAVANFAIANANTLLSSTGAFAFDDIGGPNPNAFDFGLPFFYGRTVYTAIELQNTPVGAGPYFAF